MRILHRLGLSIIAATALSLAASASAQTTKPSDLERENQQLRRQVDRLREENAQLRKRVDALMRSLPGEFRGPRALVIPQPEQPERRDHWIPRRFNNGTFYLIPLRDEALAPGKWAVRTRSGPTTGASSV